ncbi:MAG: hypothetical protein H7122_07195 [Chitinophagaceae bacterium]|nr:hypothetical protein [Chitinophagaceae bacterium]
MYRKKYTYLFFCFFPVFLVISSVVSGQVRISGTVYDLSKKIGLEAVSVLSNSGNGTITDKAGRYTIVVNENDSVWFSYLNKPTPKYPVQSIQNFNNFEISLHVAITTLPEVRIMPRNYRRDSVQNRLDYAKAFDFQKPGVGSVLSVGPQGGAGLDINEFINMFKFRRNRRMLAFQDRLLREEEERFIDHRFSRTLIIKLTQLRGPGLDTFIARYRPTVEFTQYSSDYEFQSYIKDCFLHYQRLQKIEGDLQLKKEDE